MPSVPSFLVNGEPVDLSCRPPQQTLLQFLRDEARLTGTKEGCAEGDCGACTVVLAELVEGSLAWKPINACIRLLPSLAGKAVFTVESLANADGSLHPVQQALVDTHGSQCGFCTPGFVMSLFGLYKNAWQPSRHVVDDAISGNLCRCTGYRPILAAADRMYELPAPHDWRAPARPAGPRASASGDEASLALRLAAIAPVGTLRGECGGQPWLVPGSEDALADALDRHPAARIVAGATDVGLWITKQHRDLGALVFVADARDMQRIVKHDDSIEIGAAASLTDAFAALDDDFPELREAWVRFASVPIRNSGTLGGNVANGSPIGDTMPVLIALGATLLLRRGATRRELAIEDFYLGYQRHALAPGEFIAAIRVPRRHRNHVVRAWKASRRFDQDISAVFVCFALRVDGGRVAHARIGCGGVAPVPARARRCEEAFAGMPWNRDTAAHAARTLADEFTPIDDMRASAAYRRALLANFVMRLWLDAGERVPVRIRDPGTTAS